MRLFLDEGHSIDLNSRRIISNAQTLGGQPERVMGYRASQHPWEGHRAGCSFRRLYVNEKTASVQWYGRVTFKNVPDLNKNKPDSDRER